MNRALAVLLLATLPGLAPPDDPRAPARQDLEKLQGTWTLVSMESEGETAGPDDLAGRNAVYQGDQVSLRAGDRVRRRGLVVLDPSRKPKAINTWDLDGPFADHTSPGIYELEGDTLKLCFARPNDDRPTAFTTKSGTGVLFVTYKRAK